MLHTNIYCSMSLPETCFKHQLSNIKSWRRPTLAQASPALPSTMESLTSVFGMGTGMTSPLWSPAKSC